MKQKIKQQTLFQQGDLVIVRALQVPNAGEKKIANFKVPYKGPYIIKNEQGKNSSLLTRSNY